MEPMRAQKSEPKSLDQALRVLNEAAENSAEDIRKMIDKDFKMLQRLFTSGKGEVSGKLAQFRDFGSQAKERFSGAGEQIDEAVRENPWAYIAGAAVLSAALGFLLSRRSG